MNGVEKTIKEKNNQTPQHKKSNHIKQDVKKSRIAVKAEKTDDLRWN